jgi:hypothetical protein
MVENTTNQSGVLLVEALTEIMTIYHNTHLIRCCVYNSYPSSGDQAEVQKRKNKVSSKECWSAIIQAGNSDRDEEEMNN